jgi:polar amino acid transport system substrate-binding protein/glutamate/aspartate transport system substrate-binding protein
MDDALRAAPALCRFVLLALVLAGESHANEPLRLGFRTDAPPFSRLIAGSGGSVDFDGYSVDLCRAFARSRGGAVEEVAVPTAADRFAMLADGEIDLLCGATTATLAARVTFGASLYTFVTGAGVLRREPLPQGPAPLRVGYLKRSTSADLVEAERTQLRDLMARLTDARPAFARDAAPVGLDSQDEVIRRLGDDGDLDLYVADIAILQALHGDAGAAGRGLVIEPGLVLSLEPYALFMRRDDPRRLELDRFLQRHFADPAFFRQLADRFGTDVEPLFLDLVRLQRAIPAGGETIPKTPASP